MTQVLALHYNSILLLKWNLRPRHSRVFSKKKAVEEKAEGDEDGEKVVSLDAFRKK